MKRFFSEIGANMSARFAPGVIQEMTDKYSPFTTEVGQKNRFEYTSRRPGSDPFHLRTKSSNQQDMLISIGLRALRPEEVALRVREGGYDGATQRKAVEASLQSTLMSHQYEARRAHDRASYYTALYHDDLASFALERARRLNYEMGIYSQWLGKIQAISHASMVFKALDRVPWEATRRFIRFNFPSRVEPEDYTIPLPTYGQLYYQVHG